MADDEVVDPLAGELTTANYGWVKPTVGASDDAWGGYINADLDGIDTTVKSVSTVANAAYPASNPSGYQTAAQVTAAVPVASSTTPAANGTAAVGAGTTWARADHVHPTDTSGWLGDNRIINGDMRIDQRNGGASGATGAAFTADRWRYDASQASKGNWQRQTGGAGAIANGFAYFLTFASSSAYTPLTGDTFSFNQPVEADMVTDFAWGTSSAQPVTLSFWVFSSLTGTFGGAIRNYPLPATRSYPFSYSIPVASTWTKITVVIPGDTAGTWVMNGVAAAFALHFDLGSGATLRAPAGAWAAGNFTGANGAVNVVATNAALINITGVKLEIGSVATPYNRQSLAKSMADCQRYFQWGQFFFNPGISITAGVGLVFSHPQKTGMRAAPALTASPNSSTNYTLTVLTGSTAESLGSGLFWTTGTATATGPVVINLVFKADAEL
jgi:hypothetical protein